MKRISKFLFTLVLVVSVLLPVFGVKAAGVTPVAFADLVAQMKTGTFVTDLADQKTNGDIDSYTVDDSDPTKLVITVVVDGVTSVFELKYDSTLGNVSFTDTTSITSYETDHSLLNAGFVVDVIKYAGILYGYCGDDITDLITDASFSFEDYSYDEDGIEATLATFSYMDEGMKVTGNYYTSLKLNLNNGFGGLIPDPNDTSDVTVVPGDIVNQTPNNGTGGTGTDNNTQPGTDVNTGVDNNNQNNETTTTPETEDVENPSTGDLSVYSLGAMLVLVCGIAVIAGSHLVKKSIIDEII